MIAAFAAKTAISMKKEIAVVLLVLTILVFMPMYALAAMTNVGEIGDDATLYTGNASTTNTYTFGYCTFWTAKRREEVGMPIPNTWGDAHTWDDRSRLDHYTVDHKPSLYAIMESDAGDLGHVAFVESVGTDGSWAVSEMNVRGWDIQSARTFRPAEAAFYNFIH